MTSTNKQVLSWADYVFPMKITGGRTTMVEMPTVANPG